MPASSPRPTAANNLYYAVANNTTFYREENFRVDHQIGNKLALMGSLIYDNGTQSQYPPLWAGGTYATAGSVMAVPVLGRCGARHLYHQPDSAE